MADKCIYCKQNVPTNHLILNGGDLWIEFCEPCGNIESLRNSKGEVKTVQEIFNTLKESNNNLKQKSNDTIND